MTLAKIQREAREIADMLRNENVDPDAIRRWDNYLCRQADVLEAEQQLRIAYNRPPDVRRNLRRKIVRRRARIEALERQDIGKYKPVGVAKQVHMIDLADEIERAARAEKKKQAVRN